MKSHSDKIIEAFRAYKAIGLDPLPIYPEDGHPSKRPLGAKLEGWQQKAADPGYTEADFNGPCNLGIVLGGTKHLSDIDCDNQWAVKAAGWMLDGTDPFMVFGHASKPDSHYVFFADESLPSIKINHPIRKLECVIEFRCEKKDGGRGLQSVFPPSIWCDKADHTIQEPITTTKSNPASPVFNAKKLKVITCTIAAVALLAEYFPVSGGRHDTMLALAGWFARGGLTLGMANKVVESAYGISDGYNHDRAKASSNVADVYKAYDKDPDAHLFGFSKLKDLGYPVAVLECVADLLGVKKPESTATTYTLTDTGLGLRFVDSYVSDFKYVIETQKWMTFDGSVWVTDDRQVRREKAKQIGKAIRDEAGRIKVTDEDEDDKNKKIKNALMSHANYAESTHGIDAMLKAAASDQRIVVSLAEFDKKPELINTKNGIVNLQLGILQPHDRSLLMTQKAPTAFNPSATSEVFTNALDTWTKNHPDLKAYMRRLYGYSITGTKNEEKIVIMKGLGGTGKSTFNSLLQATLGSSFVRTVQSQTLATQKRTAGAAASDLLRLEGARIVICSEIDKDTTLAQGLLKTLSGNDTQVARGNYQVTEHEFTCDAQFFIQTNFRPVIDSTDTGNQRRYIELPFDNKMTPDKTLKDRLMKSVEVREAMLAWMVQGAVEFYRDGLGTCDTVEAATTDFFADNDPLGAFLKDCLVRDDQGKITRADLLNAYIHWSNEEGSKSMPANKLYDAMRDRGYPDTKWRDGSETLRGFKGIREKTDYDLFKKEPVVVTEDSAPKQDFHVPSEYFIKLRAKAKLHRQDALVVKDIAAKPKWKPDEALQERYKVHYPSQAELDEEFGVGRMEAWIPGEFLGRSISNLDIIKYPSVFNGGVQVR